MESARLRRGIFLPDALLDSMRAMFEPPSTDQAQGAESILAP